MINRRNFIQKTALASSFFIGGAAINPLVKLYKDAGYQMRTLRNDIGVFTESGGTIGWCFHEDASVIIDTQFPKTAVNLISEMKKQTSAPLKYLLNTHHHGDHTAGNIAFKGIATTVVAHQNSKINQEASAKSRGSEGKQLYPDQTFEETFKGTLANESFTMHYWGPGHTNGDTITHFENANIAHMGDLMFNRRFPYIDKGAGADIGNWINILDKAYSHFDKDSMLIFGHSDNGYEIVGGKEDLKAFKVYLENVLKVVGKAITEGKTEKQIMAFTEIKGSPQWSGKGIQRSLSAAYLELK